MDESFSKSRAYYSHSHIIVSPPLHSPSATVALQGGEQQGDKLKQHGLSMLARTAGAEEMDSAVRGCSPIY